MNQYFFIDERCGRQRGPVSASELRGYGVGPDSLVWRNGMLEWAPAGSVRDLLFLFRSDFDGANGVGRRDGGVFSGREGFVGAKPAGLLGWAICALLLCWITGVVALVYAVIADSLWEIREFDGAGRAAERSKFWCVISVAVFLCVFLIVGVTALVVWADYR